MIQTQTYSQRDPRWKNVKLGFSKKLTIGSDGCVITSLANMLSIFGYSETPDSVNTKLKGVNGFIDGLIIWSRVSRAWPKVRFVKLTNYYNNVEVSWYVYGKR